MIGSGPPPITVLGVTCAGIGKREWRGGADEAGTLEVYAATLGPKVPTPDCWCIIARRWRVTDLGRTATTIEARGASLGEAESNARGLATEAGMLDGPARKVTFRPSERDFLIDTEPNEPLVIVRPREQHGAAKGQLGYLAAEALARRIARLP